MFVEGGTEVKDNTFTLQGLIAWLEKKPDDGIYCYHSPYRCLLHQYFKAAGVDFKSIGPGYIRYDDSVGRKALPNGFERVALGKGDQSDWTFGQALARAKAWLAA